jgi:hypothetical protein
MRRRTLPCGGNRSATGRSSTLFVYGCRFQILGGGRRLRELFTNFHRQTSGKVGDRLRFYQLDWFRDQTAPPEPTSPVTRTELFFWIVLATLACKQRRIVHGCAVVQFESIGLSGGRLGKAAHDTRCRLSLRVSSSGTRACC